MRLLIDANLSPKVAAALSKAGLESVHVGDVGLLTAPDLAILGYADLAALDDALAAVAPSVVPEGCCLVQFQELQPGAWTEVAAGDLRLPEHACDQGPYSGKSGVSCFG